MSDVTYQSDVAGLLGFTGIGDVRDHQHYRHARREVWNLTYHGSNNEKMLWHAAEAQRHESLLLRFWLNDGIPKGTAVDSLIYLIASRDLLLTASTARWCRDTADWIDAVIARCSGWDLSETPGTA